MKHVNDGQAFAGVTLGGVSEASAVSSFCGSLVSVTELSVVLDVFLKTYIFITQDEFHSDSFSLD